MRVRRCINNSEYGTKPAADSKSKFPVHSVEFGRAGEIRSYRETAHLADGPILCAGLATFNALKKSGAEPGDLIAVLGVGGLGHIALQYARRMGFEVAAIGRGRNIADEALRLGAHVYIDASREDAAGVLMAMGGAKAIISTIGHAETVSSLLAGLSPRARLVLLGVGKNPLSVSSGHFVGDELSLLGSITGTPYENEKALAFSVLVGVRPQIEVMPLAKAFEAYQRMKSGQVKFRMVLTMTSE